MQTRIIIIFLFYILTISFVSKEISLTKTSPRHAAESIIYQNVKKSLFNKFYTLDTEGGCHIQITKDSSVRIDSKLTKKPLYYHFEYMLNLFSTEVGENVVIEIDSNFKLIRLKNLINNKYLNNKYLSAVKYSDIAQNCRKGRQGYAEYVYDSIPNTLTNKPYIQFCFGVKQYEDETTKTAIDSCYKLEILTEKIISRKEMVYKNIPKN